MGYRRKIYYVILITVTAACVLAGTARHMLGMGSNRRNIFGMTETESSQSISSDSSSGEYKDDLSRFLSIDISGSAADIVLKYGKGYSISGSYSHDMKPVYKVDHNKLTISQVDASEEHILGVRDSDCVMTITVPEGAYLSTVGVSLDIGDVSFGNLKANSFNIHVGTGNILADGADMTSGEIGADTGMCRLSDMHFANLAITSGSGDVTLTSSDSLTGCTMELTTDVGDVKVFGTSHYTKYEYKSSGGRSLTVSSQTGNVTVDSADTD